MKHLSSARLAALTALALALSLGVTVVARQLEEPAPTLPARSPAELLRGVEERYRSAEQLTAEATLAVTSRAVDRTTARQGRLSLQRPGKLRWDVRAEPGAALHGAATTASPDRRGPTRPPTLERSFLSDGAELFLIDYIGREIVQLHRADDPLVLSLAFASGVTGEASLADDYAAALAPAREHADDHADGDNDDRERHRGAVALVLTPRVPGPRVRRLVLLVDPVTFEVRESIVECAHNRHRLVLRAVDLLAAPPPSWFQLTRQSPALAGFRFVDAAL
jgi:hypothetical protein